MTTTTTPAAKTKKPRVPLQLFCVLLDWNPSDKEEGDYSDNVWAKTPDEAIAFIAEAMADGGEKEFDTDAERDEFIREIIEGAGPYAASLVASTLPNDIKTLLAGPKNKMTIKAQRSYERIMAILAKHGIPSDDV